MDKFNRTYMGYSCMLQNCHGVNFIFHSFLLFRPDCIGGDAIGVLKPFHFRVCLLSSITCVEFFHIIVFKDSLPLVCICVCMCVYMFLGMCLCLLGEARH